ncbi:LCP family glycopolymer transferase [Paenibacillus sp. JCM 10914]
MKKKRSWLTWALAIIVLLPSAYVVYIYQSIKSTADHIYEERPLKSETTAYTQDPGQQSEWMRAADASERLDKRNQNHSEIDPFTILVLGVDQRPYDRGRSDAMVLMAVHPAEGSILMFNIPRDTRTPIVGHGTVDKINHAYAFGGIEMSIRTVEEFLQFPIDYYIKVDMEGFSNIIDSLGGVAVNNGMAFDYEGYSFKQGPLTLSGEEALAFSRMRYEDPKGDLGRNLRQREVIKGILSRAMNISTVFKLESLLNDIGNSVKTDITFEEMKLFVTDYRDKLQTIEQMEIAGHGQKINGVWYYMVSDKEKEHIHTALTEYMR